MTTTRARAAAALLALANRYESAGKRSAGTVVGPDWEPMPFCEGTMMHRAHLTAAMEFYELAAQLDPDIASHGFPRALLQETVGDWAAAIASFERLSGTVYADAANEAIERCRAKARGQDTRPLAVESVHRLLDWEDQDWSAESRHGVVPLAQARRRREQRAVSLTAQQHEAERAALVAAEFVNLLLDRQWSAAHAMLAPEEIGANPESLQSAFESLFEDEPYPISADVFDVQTDLEQLCDADLGWVYVSIPSEHAEAVSLVVTRHQADYRVRDVAFGRP